MQDPSDIPNAGFEYVFAATTGRAGSHRLTAALGACEGVFATHESEPTMDGRLMRWALTGQFPSDFLAQRFTMSMRATRERSRCAIRADISKVFIKWYGEHALRRLGEDRCLVIRLRREPIEVMRRLLEDGAVPGGAFGDLWSTHWMGDPAWDGCRVPVEPCSAEEAVAWHVVETIVRGEELAERMPRLRLADLAFDTISDPEALAAWLTSHGLVPGTAFESSLANVPLERPMRQGRGIESTDAALRSAWREVVESAAARGLIAADLAGELESSPESFGRDRRTEAA